MRCGSTTPVAYKPEVSLDFKKKYKKINILLSNFVDITHFCPYLYEWEYQLESIIYEKEIIIIGNCCGVLFPSCC